MGHAEQIGIMEGEGETSMTTISAAAPLRIGAAP